MPSNAMILSVAVALGAGSFVVRLWFPVDGWNFFGMQFGSYPQYIVLFGLGVLAYRRGWLEDLSDRAGRLWLRVAVVGIVALCISLLYLFRKRYDFQGKVAKLMSANAYAAYIIQAPVIIAVQLAMRGVALHPLLKFAVVTPMAVAACFAVSQVAVRRLPLAATIL